jgi:hypothetical protein
VDRLLDWVARRLAVWALRRLYGADCRTDIREDFPDEPDTICLSCDAKRLVKHMQDEGSWTS